MCYREYCLVRVIFVDVFEIDRRVRKYFYFVRFLFLACFFFTRLWVFVIDRCGVVFFVVFLVFSRGFVVGLVFSEGSMGSVLIVN